ncbi:unnamed protein product [Caenorhabditis brenneri]
MDIVNRAPLTYGRLVQHAFWIRFLRDYGQYELRGVPLEEFLDKANELGRGLEAEAEEARQRFNNQVPGALGVGEIVEALKQRANQIVEGLFQEFLGTVALREWISQLPAPQVQRPQYPPQRENHRRRRLEYRMKLQNILSLRYFQWIEEAENRRLNLQDLISLAARVPDGVRRVVMDLAEQRRWRRAHQDPQAPRGPVPVEVVDERINAAAVFIFDSFEFVIRGDRNPDREARRARRRQERRAARRRERERLALDQLGLPFLEPREPPAEPEVRRPGILRRRPEDQNMVQEDQVLREIVRPLPVRGVPFGVLPAYPRPEDQNVMQEDEVEVVLEGGIVRPLPVRGVPPAVLPAALIEQRANFMRRWNFNGEVDPRMVEAVARISEETVEQAREREARLNGTRNEMLEHRVRMAAQIDELERQMQQMDHYDINAIYLRLRIKKHQEELRELNEHFERKYPLFAHLEEEKEINTNFPITLKKCYRLICKLREIYLQEQLENTARGLPEPDSSIYNSLDVFHTMMKLSEAAPEATKDLGLERFFDDVQKLAERAEEPVEPPQKPHRLPGQFKLADHIRERLSCREVQVIEASMDHLRKSIVEGTDFPLIWELQKMIDAARSKGQTDELLPEGELIEAVEKIVESDEYKKRTVDYLANLRERDQRAPVRYQEKAFREPEARDLYVPYISKTDYDMWTEKDVHDWIRHFVHNQEHRDLIDVRRFDGPCLYSFLDSNTEWKAAGWPFGLFVRVKGHFNRVVNGDNPHFQCMRIDDF